MNSEPGSAPADFNWNDRASRFWIDMRQRVSRGQPVRVEDYLSEPDFPKHDADLILDLVYAEFALRHEAGDEPPISEYVDRFPRYAESIRRQLELHLALSPPTFDPDRDETQHATRLADMLRPSGTTPPNSMPDPAPSRIGRYRVVDRLGSGGQATVYRAVHPELGQDVAIKVSHHRLGPDSPAAAALAAEGRLLAGLRHPNLVRVFDLDQFDQKPYVVMEYIAGRSLEQIGRQQRMPPASAATIVAAIARALARAHAVGAVHLDVKPGNILIGEDGVPRLIDFGLGKFRSGWTDHAPETAEMSGTVVYMPPERACGRTDVSREAVDVFGLGGVLYFLITGDSPYRGKTITDVWADVRAGRWDREALQKSAAPRSLKAICERCLAPSAGDRYGSADQVADALERFARRPILLRRIAMAAAAISLFAIIAFLAWPRTPSPILPPLDPKLTVRVWHDDRFRDLLRSVPLETNDEVRIETAPLPGYHAALFWADPEGNVRLLTTSPDAMSGLSHPAAGQAVPVVGKKGTELIVLCARRDRPIDVVAVQKLLATVRDWPALPDSSIVRLTPSGVTIDNPSRGVGDPKRRDDPEAAVAERLRGIQSSLFGDYEVLSAIAVSHR